jgi:hypothetical protein
VNPSRKTALITGVLFLITYATSIAALFLYLPVVTDSKYILGSGNDTGLLLGAFLELLLIIANIGTAVALFPVLKRQSEGLALGFVAARVVESTFIAAGILALLTVVTMKEDAADADATSLGMVGNALVSLHQWTFLLGPGFTVGIGNGLALGYLMYRSGLVPRRMALLGLIGGPALLVSGTAVLFGVIEQGGAWQLLSTVPEFFWELFLGLWLIFKGFNRSPLTSRAPSEVHVNEGPQSRRSQASSTGDPELRRGFDCSNFGRGALRGPSVVAPGVR